MNSHQPSPALLIISHDVVGAQMAGPGIRYWQLARVLGQTLPVTLAVPRGEPRREGEPRGETESTSPETIAPETGSLPHSHGVPPNGAAQTNFRVVTYAPDQWPTLAPHVTQSEVCLLPGDTAARFASQLAATDTTLVIDGYDPVLAEWLAVHARLPLADLHTPWHARLAQQAAQYQLGDFFICASERQRDWWLGQLEAWGRINPATYRDDPSLRSLVDVVPYGLPSTPPHAARPVIKNVWPGIAQDDELILWGGGLWPWLDPLTAIRAMPQVLAQYPHARLVFPGTRHPNPEMATMPSLVDTAKNLADQLALTGRAVFFGDWIDYTNWPGVLLESRLALTLHQETLETRLAFRSRLLETIWAGLPAVTTGGDATSDLVAFYELGEIVPPGDENAVAAAILRLLASPPAAERFAQARSQLTWERAATPLLAFCRAPRPAADRARKQETATSWLPAFATAQSMTQNSAAPDTAHITGQATGPGIDELEQARAETAYWRDLAQRYAQGRVMRLLARLHRLQARLRRKP